MTGTPASALRDSSIDLTGASQVLFPLVPYNSIEERFVANPNAANPIWINPFGNPAVANGKGSFLLAAGGYWSTKSIGAINVLGTNGDHVTAGER